MASMAAAEEGSFQPPPMVVPPGYEVELVAGPPLVRHPIMASFDDRGRLYVAESAGLNLKADDLLKQLPNSLRRLEDSDGDGRFDQSTVFADKMTFPQGALWHRGAVYTASPPSIWRLVDADDDGVAEVREEIVNKFGFTGNAADIHGCFLGPDGRIYWCDGRHGHDLEARDGQPARKGLAARVFSSRLDGSDVEIFCGGGMDNPVEVAFTAEGEMLGTMTFYNPDQQRHDALVHFVWGGVYPKKHPCTSEFRRTGELMPALSVFGVTAPSGLTYYAGRQLGDDFQGNFFSTHFNTHKVVRHRLARDGGSFRSQDEDFLVSTSPDFHPTDVLEDADGSLLVIDTGGWFRIGCPTSQVAKPDILGGIYRVRRKDAAKVADPRGLKLPWKQAKPLELAARLGDPRPAVRGRAIDELAQRGEAALSILEDFDLLEAISGPVAERNLVWALAQIKSPEAQLMVREAMAAPDMSVRLAAVRSVGSARDQQAIGKLKTLVVEDEPAIRREAATALGRIGHAAAVPALLASLRAGGDRFVEHAAIYALIEINDHSSTVAGLSDPTPQVRRGALIALDQMPDGRLTQELVTPLLDTGDVALQQAALEVINRRLGWSEQIVGLLAGWLQDMEPSPERAAMLRGSLLAFRNDPKIQKLVADSLAEPKTSTAVRLLLLETMARSELHQWPPAWSQQLERSLRSAEGPVLRQAVATAAASGLDHFAERLLELAGDAKQPVELRVAALAAAARSKEPLAAEGFELLIGQLNDHTPPLMRLEAGTALATAMLTSDQLASLAKHLGQSGPLELPVLIAAFERTADAAVGKALLAALEISPGLVSLPEGRLRQVLARYPGEVQQAAEPLLKRLFAAAADDRQQLAELEKQLGGGDSARGKHVFFSKKTACNACHRIAGQGESIGPDLSKIGEVRTPRDLLEAIVLPSMSFARGFESYTVSTRSGQIYTGVIGRETAECIYLRTPQRAEIRIERDAIEEMAPSRVSVMPQGLDKTMTAEELRDLVAYLKTLK